MSFRRISTIDFMSLVFTLCLCASSVLPAETPKFAIESFRLPNGLKIALSHDAASARTTVCVAYHVGSKNERAGLTGFAHFFEHMMFRGTGNVPNFDTPLQEAGGSPNAFTSEDMTVYFETVPNSYVQRALYMEAERMAFLSSALDQEKFDTEREVVKNERRQSMENVPYGLVDETIVSLVFPKGHPYSWSVIGSMKDLNNATLDDLRRFFNEFYHPGNATLTLVGGFDQAQVESWIETYFGPLASGPAPVALRVPPTPPVSQRVTQKDRVQFPAVYWSWPTVSETNPDAPALDLLAMILSSGDASRLEQALVVKTEEALQVDASSETSEIGGLFKISAIAAPGHDITELEATMGKEIANLRSAPPSDAELARVKVKYRTSFLVGLASPMRRTITIATGLAQHDDPHYYQKSLTRFDKVTSEDIQRVARSYLVDEKVVLVVEPVGPGEEESEAVLSGPLPDTTEGASVAPQSPAAGPDWTMMPAPSEPTPFVAPRFQRRTLGNGLEVWVAPWRTLPLVSTQLLIRTGSADDLPAQAGLATLTAELWDKGTRDLTFTELAEALDALGTSLRISSDVDTTELGFTVETQSLADACRLVGEMVTQPRFDHVDFEREKQLQLSDLASGPDSASWIAARVLPKLVYGAEHPFALPGPGYKETVESLSLDDVRAFYRRHFAPQGSVLIVVGDIDVDEVTQLMEQTLGQWQGTSPTKAIPAAHSDFARDVVYVVDKPGAVQSVIAVGRAWRNRQDASFFASRIGNRILGGDFLSRINQNLRERNGFTYGARSSFDYRRAGSDWNLTTSVRSEVTGDALREIGNELSGVAGDRPLTPPEVIVARDAEINVFPQAFETPSSIADSLMQLAAFRLPDDYFGHYVEGLQAVTPDDAAKVMAQVAQRNQLVLLVVGNRQVIEPKLKESGFTQIELLDSDGDKVTR